MEAAINALVYALSIYVLALVVALLVAGAIMVIRWATADRAKPAVAVSKDGAKREEATA